MSIYTDFFPTSAIKHNAALVAPIVTNDDSQGYAIGSTWQDTVSGTKYICQAATTGAAVWRALNDNMTAFKTVAGVANVYTATSKAGTTPVTTLYSGLTILVSGFVAANTGASTLNLDGTGALPIVTAAAIVLIGGELANVNTLLTYNAGSWYISGSNGIGVGQAWQNVTGTRAFGTTYTNTTGRTITAFAQQNMLLGNTNIVQVSSVVDGVISTGATSGRATAAITSSASVYFQVPAGSTYLIASTVTGGAGGSVWTELR